MSNSSNVIQHEGVPVKLGSRDYILPPMSLGIRKRDIESRKAMVGGHDEIGEQELVTSVVVDTLKRNYPDLDVGKLEQEADFPQMLDAYAALKELEARLLTELGKRRVAAAMAEPQA